MAHLCSLPLQSELLEDKLRYFVKVTSAPYVKAFKMAPPLS